MKILVVYLTIVGATMITPSCVDRNVDFVIPGTAETISCQSIRQNNVERLEQMCEHYQIQSNCPGTCGKCCEDDTEFFIQTKEGRRIGCDGIYDMLQTTKSEKQNYCNDTRIRALCSKTCGACFTEKEAAYSSAELVVDTSLVSSGESEASVGRLDQRFLTNMFKIKSKSSTEYDKIETNLFNGSGE